MAKAYLPNSFFGSTPRPRHQWEARRQQAIRRLQQSATGKRYLSLLERRRGRGDYKPSAMALCIPRPFAAPGNPEPERSSRPPTPPSEATQYRHSRDRGLSTVSPTTGPSVPWETSRALSPTRSSPVQAASPQKTNRRPGDPETPGLRLGIALFKLPQPLPPSTIPPIPLPFSMNIHQ
ncbi:ORF3 [torque teno Delphinidae virus 30]